MLELRNNLIMALVKLGYSDGKGNVTGRHIEFYKQRSKHVGAVILEPLYPDAGLRELPTQMGIDNDDKIQELKKITDVIHENGAKVVAHLNHPGRMANPMIPGNYWWSSTNKACPNGGKEPEKMTVEMMQAVETMMVESAQRAVKAGFDIIELQYGHGYLFAQFLSPEVNDRDDEYGGSFENRIKFPLQVFKAIRKSVNVPLIIRMSASEMTQTGINIEEAKKFAKILEQNGADAFHIVAGSACANPPWFFQHMFVPKGKTWELAYEIKKTVSEPVIFVGRINSRKDIDFLKEKYDAQYFAVGRAMVADPDFAGKYLGVIDENIRPCLACAEGCLGGVKSGKGLGCVVNPTVNTNAGELGKTTASEKIAVVGGGLAGMEAAVDLTKKGHNVDLFEKDELGGQFNLAYLPPHKNSLKELVDFYKAEINRLKINVIKKDVSDSELENYDKIISATGAKPVVPPIKGLDNYSWAEILYENKTPENKKCLIVGGGLIGLEVAAKLVAKNNKVIIVEMLDEIARGMEMLEKVLTTKMLKEKAVEILLSSKLIKVEGGSAVVETLEGEKVLENIDQIVIAAGMKPYQPIKNADYVIGDAKQARKAQDAIREAYELAVSL